MAASVRPRLRVRIEGFGEKLDVTFNEPLPQKSSIPKDKLFRVESVLLRQKVGRERRHWWWCNPGGFSCFIYLLGYSLEGAMPCVTPSLTI